MLAAALVGLVAVIMILDSRLLGRMSFEQPLITCTLVGLAMGDVKTGLAVGVTMEMVTLGMVNIGAAGGMAMGLNLGAIISCAYVIKAGADIEMALAIATPISGFYIFLMSLFGALRVYMCHLADKYVEDGKFAAAKRLHIIWGPVAYSIVHFVPVFLAVYLGADVVTKLVEKIPSAITSGISLGANLMAFYGFALLLSTMMNKKTVVFFLIGFLVVAYTNMNLITVAIIGGILAAVLYLLKYDNDKQPEAYDELD